MKHEGGFFHNQVTGEVVNFGVTLTFVKDCGYCTTADLKYIQDLSVDDARKIYEKYFWDRHGVGHGAEKQEAKRRRLFAEWSFRLGTASATTGFYCLGELMAPVQLAMSAKTASQGVARAS